MNLIKKNLFLIKKLYLSKYLDVSIIKDEERVRALSFILCNKNDFFVEYFF